MNWLRIHGASIENFTLLCITHCKLAVHAILEEDILCGKQLPYTLTCRLDKSSTSQRTGLEPYAFVIYMYIIRNRHLSTIFVNNLKGKLTVYATGNGWRIFNDALQKTHCVSWTGYRPRLQLTPFIHMHNVSLYEESGDSCAGNTMLDHIRAGVRWMHYQGIWKYKNLNTLSGCTFQAKDGSWTT